MDNQPQLATQMLVFAIRTQVFLCLIHYSLPSEQEGVMRVGVDGYVHTVYPRSEVFSRSSRYSETQLE